MSPHSIATFKRPHRRQRPRRGPAAVLLAAMLALCCAGAWALRAGPEPGRALWLAAAFPTRYPGIAQSAGAPVPTAHATGPRVFRSAPTKGMFLVASQGLRDSRFAKSVVLLLSYDQTGALGVIVNRPTRMSLAELLPDVKELQGRSETIYIGGPVSISRVIVLMRSSTAAEGAEPILAGVYATGSIDTLRQFLSTAGPSDALHAYAGYAGWSGGQLESEVERGDWYLVPGDAATLFDSDPHHIWHDLLRQASGRWVRGPMLDAPVPARVALGSDVRLSRPHAERPGR